METRSIATDDGRGEIGIVVHNGREFSAGGGHVGDDYAAAYPHEDGSLCLWSGKVIGTWRAVASWRVNSFLGSRMYQIEAVIGGRRYTGRGFGTGMIWRGRLKKDRA